MNFREHLAEARAMVEYGATALGRCPEDLYEVLAELALGGPAQCALRAVSRVVGLPADHQAVLSSAEGISEAFRSFFNAPEVTAIVAAAQSEQSDSEGASGVARYWRDVVRHSIDGNLQAVLDEHAHVLRDWLGFVSLGGVEQRTEAAKDIALKIGEALRLRTSALRVDIPRRSEHDNGEILRAQRMRTRFAVAFGDQTLDEGGQAPGRRRVGGFQLAVLAVCVDLDFGWTGGTGLPPVVPCGGALEPSSQSRRPRTARRSCPSIQMSRGSPQHR